MKEYGRSRSIVSLILNPGTGGQWVVSFTLLPLYTQGQHPWYKDLHLLCSSGKPFMPDDKPRTIQKNVSNTRVHPKWHTHACTHPHSPTCTCVLTHTNTHRHTQEMDSSTKWLCVRQWQTCDTRMTKRPPWAPQWFSLLQLVALNTIPLSFGSSITQI